MVWSPPLRVAATAGTAPLKLDAGTFLSTPEVGAIESTTSGLFFTTLGDRRSLMQASQPIVASTTLTNTTDETTVYTTSLAADELITGETITTEMFGRLSTANASATITFRVKIGGTEVMTLASTAGTVTDEPWHMKSVMTVRSVGGSGTVQGYLEIAIPNKNKAIANTTTVVVDTTTINNITLTAQWDAANVGHILTVSQAYSKVIW
jgi:hypothetical protein